MIFFKDSVFEIKKKKKQQRKSKTKIGEWEECAEI